MTGPASRLAARIESYGPDSIFNTAEGRRGRAREAFYPALFEELGFPYTGSDAYVLTVTLDKWLTKLVLGKRGIDTPRGAARHARRVPAAARSGDAGAGAAGDRQAELRGLVEGDRRRRGGARRARAGELLPRALRAYPTGVLVEEFVRRDRRDGPLPRGARRRRGAAAGRLRRRSAGAQPLQPLRLPAQVGRGRARCGALPARPAARRGVAPARHLQDGGARARHARRRRGSTSGIGEDGRIYCSRSTRCRRSEPGASLFAAAAREGLDYGETLHAIVESAAKRQGLVVKPRRAPAAAGRSAAHRVHLQRQARRLQERQRRRGRVRRARDDRRHQRGARRATARSCCSRPTPSCRGSYADAGRSGLQHRRGGGGPQPRGAGAGAVRADGHPLHRLGLGDAGDRARQGARRSGCCCSTGS